MYAQRLKHAWARGARIQTKLVTWPEEQWRNHYTVFPVEWVDIRIYPDDEHLQYGPVSSALRDMALFKDWPKEPDAIEELFYDFAGDNSWMEAWMNDDDHSSKKYALLCAFCRLFYAEMLADEGA